MKAIQECDWTGSLHAGRRPALQSCRLGWTLSSPQTSRGHLPPCLDFPRRLSSVLRTRNLASALGIAEFTLGWRFASTKNAFDFFETKRASVVERSSEPQSAGTSKPPRDREFGRLGVADEVETGANQAWRLASAVASGCLRWGLLLSATLDLNGLAVAAERFEAVCLVWTTRPIGERGRGHN